MHLQEALQKKPLHYDKAGDEHYNVISAFIKSMRGSDPDAALYWMMRMFEAGEEPLFIARRMVIFASEDIGNADPQALQVAIAAKDAVHFVGLPEGRIPLAQAVTYLASAPKSNASYKAMLAAAQDVETHGALAVPLHLRNAPTGLMKNLGYGKDYQYAHNYQEQIVDQQHLPDELAGKSYYTPGESGYEAEIRERLKLWREKKRERNELAQRLRVDRGPRKAHVRRLFFDPRQIEQEKIGERGFLMAAETPRSAAVAGVHVGLEQNTIVVGFSSRNFATHLAGSQYCT